MQKKILLAFMLFGSIATVGVQAQTNNEQEPDSIEIGDFTKFMDEGDSGNNDRTYFDGIPNRLLRVRIHRFANHLHKRRITSRGRKRNNGHQISLHKRGRIR